MNDPVPQAKAIIVQTQEEERYRLARLLQRGPAQLLANSTVEIETCLRLLDTQPATARAGLSELLAELVAGLNDMRDLIANLQPPLLNEMGLVAALEKYVAHLAKQTEITITLRGWEQLTERFPATVELSIFRILQEALENVRDHSRASRVQVELERANAQLTVTIADNGRGFAPQSIDGERRLGLVAMHDRAELLGGSLQVFSEPGRGVRVVLTMPWRAPMPSQSWGAG